jgi:hypothetical protein
VASDHTVGDEPTDALFALEPKDFTAARDALAKQLRADGDRDAAAAVKALRRPTVAAWALNQVARDDASVIHDLLGAAGTLRTAQADALRSGDPDELRAATRQWRDAVQAATEVAVSRTTESQRDDIIATLEAALADHAVAEALRAGRLTTAAHGGSGFDIAGMPDPSELAPAKPHATPPDRKRLERALEAAEQSLADAQARVEDARAAVADAEHVLRQREERLRDAQQARAAAAAALDPPN